MKLLFTLLLLASCSGPETYDHLQIMEMARKGDPDLEIMLPPSLDKPLVYCSYYKPPCFTGYKVKIKKLMVTALEYKDPMAALISAKAIDGYIARNWVFDDVRGEPILERFVVKYLGAKLARDIEVKAQQ